MMAAGFVFSTLFMTYSVTAFYTKIDSNHATHASDELASTASTALTSRITRVREAIVATPCQFTSYQDGHQADCRKRQLTSFPRGWPGRIVRLDMSGNDVAKLYLDDLDQPELRGLRHLDLSGNKLEGSLANGTFLAVPELQVLLLKNNKLESFQSDAMTGLSQLTVLDLSSNLLKLNYDVYPPRVFQPLRSLRELYLIGNDAPYSETQCYPDQVFLPLSKLTTLSIDPFPHCAFDGEGFKALRNLRSLTLVGDGASSYLKVIKNNTLSAFRNSSLEELRIGSSLMGIETCALCELPSLKVLRATSTVMNVQHLLAALYGLQHQNMTLIDFSGNSCGDSIVLDREDFQYLHTICVSQFLAVDSHIQRIKNRALVPGPRHTPFLDCLEHVDISSNCVTGDFAALFAILEMKAIKTIQLQTQNIFSLDTAECLLGQDQRCRTITDHSNAKKLTLFVSPTLQFLNLSGAIHRIGAPPDYFIVHNASSLTVLDLSYIKLSNCITTILGLPVIETLDLSGNYCYNISETIFDALPTLKHLRLSNFDLNLDFFRIRGRRLFKELGELQSLDLSFNRLSNIDPFLLSAQRTLKQVNLARNGLEAVSIHPSVTPTLEVLDLSDNRITTLSLEERRGLDELTSTHVFALRLRGNPLLCACSNLDFLQWLFVTRVRLDGDGRGGNYTCVLDTGEVTDTETVVQHYDYHWRRCAGPRTLGMATAAFLVQLLAILSTFIISRSWTHIRYMIKVMCHLRLPQRRQFRRDVYVGYADADCKLACVTLPQCLEQRHDIRLLLRGREEVPGSVRAENIVDHIDDSWKVLLLVTRAFAEDEWLCGFTVQQAQRSITDTLPDRVLVLFLDDPDHLLPMASLNKLLRMVPERNVLHVQGKVTSSHPVWDVVARDILGDQHQF